MKLVFELIFFIIFKLYFPSVANALRMVFLLFNYSVGSSYLLITISGRFPRRAKAEPCRPPLDFRNKGAALLKFCFLGVKFRCRRRLWRDGLYFLLILKGPDFKGVDKNPFKAARQCPKILI